MSGLSKATDSSGIDKGIELGNGRGIQKDGGVSHIRDLHKLPDLTVVAILHALFKGRPGVHLDGGIVEALHKKIVRSVTCCK